jgi:serine/threonine protein kinase
VALKAVASHLTREPHHRERLRREARAAAMLTHPGICTVYALEELEGELYIATEFVEGHTLRAEVSSPRRPTIETIIATARELASALAAAHAKGITHRDLKPENVMRTPEGRIKILDFGLARVDAMPGGAARTLTAAVPGAIAGTPAYMAPEQIEGQHAGPAADVFAFGVLMYEWISGRHPFQAGSPLATLARVIDSKPEPLSSRADVPLWLSDVIDQCLRKPVAERLGSGSDLLRAFDHPAITPRVAPRGSTWWSTHQVVAIVLYTIAVAQGWQIKESLKPIAVWTFVPLWLFVLLGIAGSVGGIIRGHLVFTAVMNRPRLMSELRRTKTVRLFSDLLIAALLTIDALLLAPYWPLTTVLTISLAAGIAIAAIVMEPATTAALLGE